LGKSLDLWTLSAGFPEGLSVLEDLLEHCSKNSDRDVVLLDVEVSQVFYEEIMNCVFIDLSRYEEAAVDHLQHLLSWISRINICLNT
jgi:hypothetical protein